MARATRRLPHNAEGSLYVDSSCIDCDTCRWMAPATFDRRDGQSSVVRQPEASDETRLAMMALLSCPTSSIGMMDKIDLRPAEDALPARIDGQVYHCGYHHESSFGAASYLVRRPGGNLLCDSPRFTAPLVRRLEELGGVRWMFLTHQDDVADHARFQNHFGCERILHERDVSGSTRDVEIQLAGDEPVTLDGDLVLVPTPGHTAGSVCLIDRERYLFSGDHVAWSERLGHVYAFRSACWYDWGRQIEAMRALAQYRFEWILPGHGRRCHLPAVEMKSALAQAIDWMVEAA